MITVKGKFNEAQIFAETVEESALEQIKELCDREEFKDNKIRIMPDVHAGAGCTIGTTMTLSSKVVVPNMVGVDIGCGMLTARLPTRNVPLEWLDNYIRERVPSGKNVHENICMGNVGRLGLEKLYCKDHIDIDRAYKSVGTLGGGNHFIEVDRNPDNNILFLVIHTGSRHLGLEVAKYYQSLGSKSLATKELNELIATCKIEGREKEIQGEIEKFKCRNFFTDYISGRDFDNYIHDMKIVQAFAKENREEIAEIILRGLYAGKLSREFHPLLFVDYFHTVHNYIDTDDMIMRKGAISAGRGEEVLIPMNMQQGCLYGRGCGNKEWNYSAPHGAGRRMSRKKARENLSLEEFKEQMKDVYTTSISEDTLDEAPNAYKSTEDIIKGLSGTVDILGFLKPIYNYKAGGE